MIEEFDDSDEREYAVARKEAEQLPAHMRPSWYYDKPICPYCIPAKKAGAPGDRWHQDGAVRHWVRVADDKTNLWNLDAACGATFKVGVDSGD